MQEFETLKKGDYVYTRIFDSEGNDKGIQLKKILVKKINYVYLDVEGIDIYMAGFKEIELNN